MIIPVVRERRDVLEPGLESFARQSFPARRILIVFALEERAPDEVKQDVRALAQLYKTRFKDLLTIVHPADVPGEARVKGANVTSAAREAADFLRQCRIPFPHVITSCFDADTVVGPEYFSCLTYHYLVTPDRERCSFQPIPVYHNNIWDVPGFARVIETGSSFFQLIEATNPERLVTFSSHSMSFSALVEAGYWPVGMISDDSAIFWKCYIHFEGRYRVVPMYVTLSMDVAGSASLRETMRSVYKQKRRWAWGVENFPIVMRAFLRRSRIPLTSRLGHAFKLFEGHLSWSTWGFLLTVIGWLPALAADRQFMDTVVYYNAPRIAGTIFNLAFLSLVTSIVLSVAMLPRAQTPRGVLKRLVHAFEWLGVPVVLLLFSSLPALDAQTRLMLGRHMEFWVTEKRRGPTS